MIFLSRKGFVLRSSAALMFGAVSLSVGLAPRAIQAQDTATSIVVAVPQSPSALEPVLRNNTSTLQTIYSVYDRLLTIDFNTGTVGPGLAESWTQVNPTTFEFTLRQGIKFHDGGEMTADDVVFSYSDLRLLGPGGTGATVAKQYHRTIESVEKLDDYRVRITTNQVDPTILLKVGGWAAEIVSKAAFEAAGGWDGWANMPIGTGPYRIVEHRQDEVLILETHDEYWGDGPAFERIEFRVVPEAVVRVNGLLAGDFDLVTFVSPDQIAQIEAREDLEIVGGAIQNVRTLNFFQVEGVFADPLLRRAVSHAIDRELIVDSIWQGRTEVAPGFQHPAYGQTFLQDFGAPTYDPEMARRLIEEAGYDGEEIVYRTQTAAYPLEIQTAQVIQEMLRNVGLNVRLEVVENWAQVEAAPTGSTMYNNSTLIAWPDPTGGLLRQYGPGLAFSTDPYTWSNSEFEELAIEFDTVGDPGKRRSIHRRMLEIWQEEDPAATVLFYNALFYGKRTDVSWAPYPSLYADYGPNNRATMN